MDIETKIKNFIDYAREVCLQSLLLADNIKVDLKSQDNLYEVERIDNEVISKYENIYLLLDETTLLDIYKKDEKVFEKIEEASKKMAEDNKIIEETENKLSKKWYYEIYGTTDKETLLEAYNTK